MGATFAAAILICKFEPECHWGLDPTRNGDGTMTEAVAVQDAEERDGS